MQLTNIARDVGEDARAGRLYLPLAWMRAAGIDPDRWLEHPHITDRLRRVVQELLYVAEGLYVGVESGIAQLPAACRPGIRAARAIYAEIGNEVARAGYDSVSRRAVVPASRKAWLLLQAFLPMLHASANATPTPLPTNRFLVDAVAAAAPRRGVQPALQGVAFPLVAPQGASPVAARTLRAPRTQRTLARPRGARAGAHRPVIAPAIPSR